MTPTPKTEPVTVQVDLIGRGAWEVAQSDEEARITCATLDEARRIAYRQARAHPPCELIVRDAYHRVLRREMVDGPSGPARKD